VSCPCDKKIIFKGLDIAAGLDYIPRQVGGFPQFRQSMLAAIRHHAALNFWHARDEDDMGLMLLEMWAYVCDVVSFYDEVIANENYLRTADLRPSLRKLTGLLGYVPRPAVASSVILTALAEGRKALTLKKGIAFRSEAFDGEAPQVFELDKQATIHPLNNNWKLNPQRQSTIGSGEASGGAHDYLLLKEDNKKLQKQDIVLIQSGSHTSRHTVVKRSEIVGDDEKRYIKLDISPALSISTNTSLDDIEITTPTQKVGLWTMGSSPVAIPTGESELILDGLYRQLKAGQFILVSRGNEHRWFELMEVSDTMMDATSGGEFSVKNIDDETVTLTIPAAQAPATKLTLDVNLNHSSRKESGSSNWDNGHRKSLIVQYSFINVGELTRQLETAFDDNSDLVVAPLKGNKLETPVDSTSPSSFVLQDVNEISVQGNGTINYESNELEFQADNWTHELTPPVKVFGNILKASRGETVTDEILGSGDATQANQSFTLKKNPLTYISAPTSENERGVKSTLIVWVDGVQWSEVSTFFNQDAEEEVYIVRQNDDHETIITFGDGKRGRRLPTGVDNIIASYRYGAGAASPPANTITQLAKPVKGLNSVNNPFPASGGDDAEEQEGIRDYAPQSTLLLGRAISVHDFIAAAAGQPGVLNVAAEWRWNDKKQRPVIQLWYIGGSDSKTIETALRNLADPSIALDVDKATQEPMTLSFDVKVDDNYIEDDVLADVYYALTNEHTGMLAKNNIGIGTPLYRSQFLAVILAVPGTVTVTNLEYNETPFETLAIKPPAGKYYDFQNKNLIINGKVEF